jgi:uncharacterized tellurite resistance protein B-like protein
MLQAIKSFFQQTMSEPGEPDAREEAEGHRLRVAACALLLELAHADDEFTDDERRHLEEAVRRQFGLGEAEAEELIRLAEAERIRAVDLWQFSRLINEHYTIGQKMVLAEVMWGLIFSDGELANRETLLMRKISNLLVLKPGFLSEARKRARGEADDPADYGPD